MLADLSLTITQWRVWMLLGNQDIRIRYKRSYLGPFWISISLAATIAGISYLYAEIFQQPVKEYALFFAGGLIAWTFISSTIAESATMVVDEAHHLRAVKIGLPVLAARIVYRNLIIFMHNMVVGMLIVLLTGHSLSMGFLMFIPGVCLLAIVAFFMSLAIAPLCVLYRDLPEIIRNIILIMFFITPIIWMPGQAGRKSFLVDYNPLQGLINLVRTPITGTEYGDTNYLLIAICLFVLVLLGLFSLQVSRHKIYNWL